MIRQHELSNKEVRLPSWEFNVSGAGQHLLIQNPSEDFDPKSGFTVEAIGTPLAAGQEPTIIARPMGAIWAPPFVAYRLGFTNDTLLPEFQLLVEGGTEPAVARSMQPAKTHEQIHLAGTFDGETVRLFVNGLLVTETRNPGIAAKSKEPIAIGARSASDLGGFYVGRLYEIRFWKVARSPEEIQFWHNRIYPLPAPSECFALYQTAGGLGYETAKQLDSQGFSDKEIAWGSFLVRYGAEFDRLAPQWLSEKVKGRLGDSIHQTVLVKARDG